MTVWEIKFFVNPLGANLSQPQQALASLLALIIAALLGTVVFRKVVVPLADSLAGRLSPLYEIMGGEYDFPVVCFRILPQPDWRQRKIRMKVFSQAIAKVLHSHYDWGNTDLATLQTGTEWVVVGIKLTATEIFDLTRETLRTYRAALLTEGIALEISEVDVGVGMERGQVFSISHPIRELDTVPAGIGVDGACRLASVSEKGTVLLTKNFLNALEASDDGYDLAKKFTRRLGYLDLGSLRPDVYEVYISGEIGRPQVTVPQASILYDTDALSVRLLELLSRAGIQPWPQVEKLRDNADKSVLAIDGVISIVEPPGYKGWKPDPNLVVINLRQRAETITYWPPNWHEELREKYGQLEEGAINRNKVFIDKWDPPILDRGGKLRLWLGISTYRDNRALEAVLNLNRKKRQSQEQEGEFDWITFEWKSEDEWDRVFRWRDGRLVDLRWEYFNNTIDFWEYLPNMIVLTPIVISSDNKIVFMRRSNKVKYYPGHWSISLEEQIDPNQDALSETLLRKATERAVEEELGVKIREMEILSIYREWHNGVINVAILAHVDRMSGSIENAWRQAVDEHEAQQIHFEPFMDLDNMLNILRTSSYKGGKFHPGSRYRLLLALLAEHGFETVIQKLGEIVNYEN
ncbi:MAG: hypothetical protein L0332_03265 [Chloroflexi bacterium]|nr:hypothetical protein [Chloroflexota bacterium]MCI0645875.1 hypothetical protein [Chloroflexota bacterium]MCI0725730.1 hypothetical protein [Chloroflexota bacterium]